LVEFKENYDNFDKKKKKRTPLLPMTLINRFERSCGTFKGRGGNPMLSLGHFA